MTSSDPLLQVSLQTWYHFCERHAKDLLPGWRKEAITRGQAVQKDMKASKTEETNASQTTLCE